MPIWKGSLVFPHSISPSFINKEDILLMQSFHSYSDIADMDVKISFSLVSWNSPELFFRTTSWNYEGYTLLKNVSSHRFQNLCIRSVTAIQYEKSILYTLNTFSSPCLKLWFIYNGMLLQILVFGLSSRKLDFCHSHIDEVLLCSQWIHLFLSVIRYSYKGNINTMNGTNSLWLFIAIFCTLFSFLFWWIYNTTGRSICQHIFTIFLFIFVYYMHI